MVRGVPALLALALTAPAAAQERAGTPFDHTAHRRLFPSCTTCHLGAAAAGAPLWPNATSCASCHDGTIQARVAWWPPADRPATNLRFEHGRHRGAVESRPAADRPGCVTCHADTAAPWMAVSAVRAERCLGCHGVRLAHLAAPAAACATCHLSLAEARGLTRRDIAAFPRPPSHLDAGFSASAGHGAQASLRPAASCATCHARDFCVACHVDAPEQAAIQALAQDPRSLAMAVRLRPPASHSDAAFLTRHGGMVRSAAATCRTCHTRESCLTCHAALPREANALLAAGPGRGRGAAVSRRAPPSHGDNFAERHGGQASAAPRTCAGCHIQPDCLSCHRPDASAGPGYHPAGFLVRHPVAAYARQTSCTDCHNVQSFCAQCHKQAGLVAPGPLRSGYHDAKRFFLAGHGQAARQNLESCVTCHAERDCLACHSAVGGRRLSPHGPGFDADRLRRKSPEMCTACHGTAIPTR